MHEIENIWRGVRIRDLCKHLCVFAMSGNYKSSLIRYIMILLFKMAVPTIIFEPGKREYRTMKAMACTNDPDIAKLCQAIRVYTPGDDNISPLRLNPLEDGWEPTSQKIDNAGETICASGDYFDPLPQIIYEALSMEYFSHQYNNGPKPHIGRLLNRCLELLSARYGPEIRDNLVGALSSRLSKLSDGFSAIGRIFSCGENIPSVESLVAGCSIIELKALGNSDFPLVALQQLQGTRKVMENTPWLDKSKPRLVIILEECHRFFPNLSDGEIGEKVTEFIINMLQEMRALGVAIILVDQTPSALPVSVLKATATKLVGRQVYGPDRQILADCMLLNDSQRECLAHLQPREFYILGESYTRAVKIRVPDIYKNISIPFADELLGEKILKYIKEDKWFKDCRDERITAELKFLAEKINDFSTKAENLTLTVKKILSFKSLTERQSFSVKSVQLYRKIENLLQDFHKNHLIPLAGLDNNTIYVEPHKSFREYLISRFETIKTHLNQCQRILHKNNKF